MYLIKAERGSAARTSLGVSKTESLLQEHSYIAYSFTFVWLYPESQERIIAENVEIFHLRNRNETILRSQSIRDTKVKFLV